MNKPIYVVGGSKGGVGKSMVSMGLTHFLIESGERVFLIDADTSNPDVFKSYKDEVDSEIVNLDDADGWVRFVDICDEHKDSTLVVNTAARNNVGVAAYGGTLSRSLEELACIMQRGEVCASVGGAFWRFFGTALARGRAASSPALGLKRVVGVCRLEGWV